MIFESREDPYSYIHQVTLEARMMETKAMLEIQFIEVAIVHPGELSVKFIVSLHKNWQNVLNYVAILLIHMVYFNS
jgi:hypothetical protein